MLTRYRKTVCEAERGRGMLEDIAKAKKPEKEELRQYIKAEKEKLAASQMKIKEAKLPVMVIFEGWGSAGKGSVMGEIIKNIGQAADRGGIQKAFPVPVFH